MSRADLTARAYVAQQATTAADRARRGVVPCRCGAEYAPTPDGRRRHRTVIGHTPQPAREEDQ